MVHRTPRSIQTSRPSSPPCRLSPVSGPLGSSWDKPASPSALFPPRTSEEKAVIREKRGQGLSRVGRGHGATCILGCPHEECESVGLGHQEGQTVGLSKQSRAWGPHGEVHPAWPVPSALPLLGPQGGGIEQCWWSDHSCPQALPALALQALGQGSHGVWVPLCPARRPGGLGKEALMHTSPVQKLPSQDPVGTFALHMDFKSRTHISF